MNILFVTLVDISGIGEPGIYTDLLRALRDRGNSLTIVSPSERRTVGETQLLEADGCRILKVRIGNVQKTGLLEKGLSTVLLEGQMRRAVRKYLSDVRFALILYSTPPITLAGVVRSIKKRDGARTYLLLKDIFPQNAVDLGMMAKDGPRSALYRYFRRRERELYRLSDRIGCMSQANVEYLLRQNPWISRERVEVCPNSIEPVPVAVSPEERRRVREKYGIPTDRVVFAYGGNLGKPQGVPFLIDCLRTQAQNDRVFFLIVGAGTEYPLLDDFLRREVPKNVRLLSALPRGEFDQMIACCDVGMIFLDARFTIPNFPSRLLSYMQARLPVLCCTDPHTDVGAVCTAGGFGWSCTGGGTTEFAKAVDEACQADRAAMGERAQNFLNAHFTVALAADKILKSFSEEQKI